MNDGKQYSEICGKIRNAVLDILLRERASHRAATLRELLDGHTPTEAATFGDSDAAQLDELIDRYVALKIVHGASSQLNASRDIASVQRQIQPLLVAFDQPSPVADLMEAVIDRELEKLGLVKRVAGAQEPRARGR